MGPVIDISTRRRDAALLDLRESVDADDRRAHARIAATDLPWLKGARLKYGAPLSLIDLSAGGAQVETFYTLKPGSTIVVQIEGQGHDYAVASQVLRCYIASIAPTTYRGALAFKRVLELPGLLAGSESTTPLDPAHEFARLSVTLMRLSALSSDRDPTEAAPYRTSLTDVGQNALAAASMALELPSAKRGGAALSRELASLFREIRHGIERGDPADLLIGRIAQHLWHAFRVKIRVDNSAESEPRLCGQIVSFELPPAGDRLAARLVVDFGRRARPSEEQLHVLRAAAHLATLARDLDEPNPIDPAIEPDLPILAAPSFALPAPIATVQPALSATGSATNATRAATNATGAVTDATGPALDATDQPSATGQFSAAGPAFCKIIVRYADGRMLKGYTNDFLATKRYFHLAPTAHAPRTEQITVPMGHLKAVFFVRDFVGESGYVERKTFDRRTPGRRIAVTFLDDEVLVGTTLNYRPDGGGFFVIPADSKSNNLRIFVVPRAVRHVRFV